MYLLDTNVVSELRKPRPHGAVVAWIRGVDDKDLFLSAVTIGEIQAGIELTRDQDEAKAAEIEAWLELVAASYNVLPMDAPAFRAWALLMHHRSDTVIEDAMIDREAASPDRGDAKRRRLQAVWSDGAEPVRVRSDMTCRDSRTNASHASSSDRSRRIRSMRSGFARKSRVTWKCSVSSYATWARPAWLHK